MAADVPFAELKVRYNLTGTESYNLIEAGLDSLDLVVFMHELKELLKDKGAEMLARQVDIGVIQRVSVGELFGLAEQLQQAPEEALEPQMLADLSAALQESPPHPDGAA